MRVVAFSLFLLLSAVCAPAMAQTAPLEAKQKAVIAFEIRMDAIRTSDLGVELKMEDKLGEMHTQSGGEGPNPSKLDRVTGAMSAPENMEAAMSIQMGEMPIDFFVKLAFNDEAAVTALIDQVKEKSIETVEQDGKTYYEMPADGGPAGVLIHQVDSKTVEAGTKTYLFQADRNLMTENLSAAAKKSSGGSVRIAMDLDGAKGLVAEAVAMGKQQAPDPMVGVYMDLIDNMKDVSISLDVSGENLLLVKATGVNEADAVELKEGLDSLLGMAKMGIKGSLPMIREQDPDGAAVVEQLATSLTATNEGMDVSITIPKPEGFDAWVVKQLEMLEQLGMLGR